MQVKRFFAADMRQAMKLVRDELGADASIIGNRRVAGGVELTAALEYQMPAAPARQANPAAGSGAAQDPGANCQRACRADNRAGGLAARMASCSPAAAALAAERQAGRAMASRASTSPADQQALDAMRAELHGLRELIEVQLGSIAWGQLQSRQPQQASLWRRLQRLGLSAELSRQMLERVARINDPRQAWRLLLAHLAHAIRIPEQEVIEEGGLVALVGPAGMGKTTTLAKLAARYVLKYGAQNMALVSMDSYRIGAQEQLKTLGRILNVPVLQVDPGQSLSQVLAPLARKKLVLIDTAGLPANDPALRLQLEALASRGFKAKNYPGYGVPPARAKCSRRPTMDTSVVVWPVAS